MQQHPLSTEAIRSEVIGHDDIDFAEIVGIIVRSVYEGHDQPDARAEQLAALAALDFLADRTVSQAHAVYDQSDPDILVTAQRVISRAQRRLAEVEHDIYNHLGEIGATIDRDLTNQTVTP